MGRHRIMEVKVILIFPADILQKDTLKPRYSCILNKIDKEIQNYYLSLEELQFKFKTKIRNRTGI